MNDYLQVILFSASSFAVLFVISKLLGKKQIAELNFIDYVVGISIGSIAAEMATELEKDIWVYLIAMGMFFMLDFVISYLGIKTNCLKKFFKGSPTIVISEGQFVYKALKKVKLDVNEIVGLARSQGYFDISDIAYAIFETNGQLSILPKSNQKQVVIEDIDKKLPPASIKHNVIVDGTISKFALNELNKDKTWLYKKLGIKYKSDLKKILLASYDEDKDQFTLFNKQ